MGISTGLQAAHNDDLHTGNAKRAVASGLASLDASSKVVQEPATKGLASGLAPLDAGSKVAVANLPVNVASGIAGLDASSRVPAAQLALAELIANKNAASGYAGLDASSLLALTQQLLNFKIGTFTRDTSIASGNQAITGVGFTPRLVYVLAVVTTTSEVSIGFGDGTHHYSVVNNHVGAANTWIPSTSMEISLIQGAGIQALGIITLDADGFTVAWTKIGAKAGTATIIYLAIR